MSDHELHLGGHRFALRPLGLADSAFVVELRSDPNLAKFINPTSPRVEDQERWTEEYLRRSGDYYFIVEDRETGDRLGAVSLYHVDEQLGEAEMGRWVIARGSLAAPESALLVYRAAFEELGLLRVYCRTIAANVSVVSFHRSCGLLESPNKQFVTLHGIDQAVVEQFVDRQSWPVTKARLEAAAEAAARLLSR